jgi:sugar phosphate permease
VRASWLLPFFFVSGFCSSVCGVVWLRQQAANPAAAGMPTAKKMRHPSSSRNKPAKQAFWFGFNLDMSKVPRI